MKAGLATTDLLLAGICRSTHCFKTFIVSLFARDDSNNIGFFLDYESLMLEQNFIFPSSQHKIGNFQGDSEVNQGSTLKYSMYCYAS
jgi:hypothetical protein